ncbi:MAG TPA: zf-HC2 domain-containing protein [Candidatus Hydrogenedentes bacterium]|nr:zf-HC2 domain-containing protein [Candidatus Hydrogenedentota bacterium]
MEDLAFGLLDFSVRRPLDEHVRHCGPCQSRLAALRSRADALGTALGQASAGPSTPCPDSEVLALYLDHALSREDRASCEQHLAECPTCHHLLVAMYRDLAELGDDHAPWVRPTDNQTKIPPVSVRMLDKLRNSAKRQAE